MESPRFYPNSNSPKYLQLQKQIYLKEEKSLGLSITPLKQRLESILKDPNRSANVSPSRLENQFNPTQVSENRSQRQIPVKLVPNLEQKLETFYRSRISAATKTKATVSQNISRPVPYATTDDTQKLFAAVFYKKNENEFLDKLNRELNTRKVVKGKGYKQSFIFND